MENKVVAVRIGPSGMSASIFVSHSAKDPEGRAYLEAIVDALKPSNDAEVVALHAVSCSRSPARLPSW